MTNVANSTEDKTKSSSSDRMKFTDDDVVFFDKKGKRLTKEQVAKMQRDQAKSQAK